MPTKTELVANLKAVLTEARTAMEAGDEPTAAKHLETAESYKASIDKLNADAKLLGHIDDLSAQIEHGTKAARPTWSVKNRAPESPWVKEVAARLDKVGGQDGAKAVTTGTIGVPTPIRSDVIGLPEYPTRLLDLLVDRQAVGGTGDFSYLRQTVRTDLAAPVADNALKPTSVYTFGEVTGKVHVIAHLSEKIPVRFLSDYAGIEMFLRDEMERGLHNVVEDQVLNGDGTGENMTGILETSGIQVQAWSTDLLTTLRKAITRMELYGEVPNAWAINPADVEVLDLLSDNEARFYYSGPQQAMGSGTPVWSLPVVKSAAVTAGQAILADWNYVRLMVREDANFMIDMSGDLFTHNQFIARLEGRYGCAVMRPSAFCTVDTAA